MNLNVRSHSGVSFSSSFISDLLSRQSMMNFIASSVNFHGSTSSTWWRKLVISLTRCRTLTAFLRGSVACSILFSHVYFCSYSLRCFINFSLALIGSIRSSHGVPKPYVHDCTRVLSLLCLFGHTLDYRGSSSILETSSKSKSLMLKLINGFGMIVLLLLLLWLCILTLLLWLIVFRDVFALLFDRRRRENSISYRSDIFDWFISKMIQKGIL